MTNRKDSLKAVNSSGDSIDENTRATGVDNVLPSFPKRSTDKNISIDDLMPTKLALSINDTSDHVINSTEAANLSFTVSGLGGNETGTVTFTDPSDHQVVVNVRASGNYSADLSTLTDGSITSTLSATGSNGIDASATGNAVLLDTDNDLNPSLSVDATNPAQTVFTVSGLEGDETGTVTFTDAAGRQDVVPIASNGTYSANLSNLSDGTITYLLSVRDSAGNVITVDPPLNLGDGSANAPAGAAQLPTLLGNYAVRPSWNVAGVDYHVGIPTGTILKDPATISMAGVSVDASNHVVTVNGNNITLNGYDFSLSGGWEVVINGANDTIENSNFEVGTNLQQLIYVNPSASDTTIINNNIDGAGLKNAFIGYGLINASPSGTLTIEYNSISNAYGQDIVLSSQSTLPTTYVVQYNLIENAGFGASAGAHGDWIQTWNGAGDTISDLEVNFNTWVQNVPASQASTQGLSLQSGNIAQGPVLNESVSNNTIVTTSGSYVSYAIIVDNTNLNGTSTVQNNYIDPAGVQFGWSALGAFNGSPSQPGWGNYNGTITTLNNTNMMTGAYYVQNVTSVRQVVSSLSTGTEVPGNTITFALDFSGAVTVAGTPTLSLNDGGVATYIGGSGTSALTFSYTVGASDTAVSNLAITQANLPNGATIKDAAGNAANLAGAVTTLFGLQADPPASGTPVVTSLSPAPVISSGVANTNESVTLTGTAPTGSTVTVSDGGSAALGSVTASSTGAWSYTTAALAAGTHAFTATDATSAGTSAASSPLDVTVPGSSSQSSSSSQSPSSSQSSGTNLVADGNFATGGFSGWTLGGNDSLTSFGPQIYIDTTGEGGSTQAAAIGSMGSDGTVSQTIATTAGQTYTLSFWIQNNGAGPNDFSATWNGQTLLSLSNAATFGYTEYTYTVTATGISTVLEFSGRQDPSHWDLDNISLTANGTTLTTTPAAPVIQTGVVNPNTDSTVTLTGTAPAGSTVTVSDGGSTPLGTATASSSGAWSYSTPDLAAGTYAFTATDTTSAGTSIVSSPLDATVPGSSSQPSGSSQSSGTNLVANGNFATGGFSGWTLGGNDSLTSFGPQIYIDTTGEGGSTQAAAIGSMGSDGTVSQTMATTAGQTYTLSFWLQNNGAGPNDFSATWNGQTLLSLSNAATFGYTEYTYTVTATGSSTVLEFSGRQDPSHWDLDNISLTANATSSTTGPTTIATGATLEIATTNSQSVTFTGATGMLKLDAPSTFSGKIFNFTGDGTLSGSDQIDLANINFNSVTDRYANGVLTVTDGTNTDMLNFNGQYTLANFKFASDGGGGTIVYDPPVPPSSSGGPTTPNPTSRGACPPPDDSSAPAGMSPGIGSPNGIDLPSIAFDPQTTLGYLPNRQPTGDTRSLTDGTHGSNIALLGSYMASSFAMAGYNYGGAIVAREAMESHHPLLAGPQHA